MAPIPSPPHDTARQLGAGHWHVACFDGCMRHVIRPLLALGTLACLGCDPFLAALGEGLPDAAATDPDEDTSGPAGPDGDTCGDRIIGSEPRLSRLSPRELLVTWRSLTDDDGVDLILEADVGRALTGASVQAIDDATFELAERALSRREIVPCDPDATRDDACATSFIEDFAVRAFRRPLDDEERDWLLGIYRSAATDIDFRAGLTAVTAVMLQAPQLIYVHEQGTTDVDTGGRPLDDGVRALTGPERATRLALFLTGQPPDALLIASAIQGELDTAEGVARAADRLLQAPAARAVVTAFFTEMLELDGAVVLPSLEANPKDAERFPEDSPALRRAMRTETLAFVERVTFDEPRGWSKLFTATDAYVNAPLASLYGLDPTGLDDETFQWTQLPAAERSGLLTRAAFLSLNAGQHVQSPIRRGVAVLRHQLCVAFGDPPPNVSDLPVEGGTVTDDNGELVHLSVRDDVARKTNEASCMGCHGMINPAGFAFEKYDAMGRFQTHDTGTAPDGTPFSVAIDDSGELVLSDVAGPVAGALEVSARLADSGDVRRCFVEQWLARALRRPLSSQEACSVDRIVASFEQHDDIKAVLKDIAMSDAFLYLGALPAPATPTPEDPPPASTSRVQGVRTSIYDGTFTQLPDFSTLTPGEVVVGATFDISARGATDNFAFRFEAEIDVDEAGSYTFFTTSDDGSRLFIDGELVVDNDLAHAAQERSGTVDLGAGTHEITVAYFEVAGRERLLVEWSGPSVSREEIPAERLFTPAE